jgi:hypothetical protein
MTKHNNGGPALPLADSCREYRNSNRSDANGMELRDYFAAKAMHASLSLDPANAASSGEHARWAYEMADAMLKAREPACT